MSTTFNTSVSDLKRQTRVCVWGGALGQQSLENNFSSFLVSDFEWQEEQRVAHGHRSHTHTHTQN